MAVAVEADVAGRRLAVGWVLAMLTGALVGTPGCTASGGGEPGAAGDGGDGGATDGGANGDGGQGAPELVISSGDRVLVYTGHGGMAPQGSGKARFDTADARFQALGYNTHYRDVLPDDLAIYRLVLLVAPGSSQPVPFTDDEVARLEAARAVGSRLAILGDPSMCGAPEVDALLAALGVDSRFTGDGADENQVIVATDLGTQQPVAGLASLYLRDPCAIDPAAGAAMVRDDLGRTLATIELPADGGEVVVLGDLEVLDDGSIDEADNARFADNLARLE
ncbi:MAG: hypothetical protein D6798_13850 [Deltaproteobacteria bacterium]|nr:MAG: hypothetical protein D6798_13850 [Deltaproteobacteria bacterium]